MYLHREMVCNELKPDRIAYFTMISGLTQAGRVKNAYYIACSMKEDGYKLDLRSYNILINGFCKKKMLDKAGELLDEMVEAGLQPHFCTYNMLASFCQIGDFSTITELLHKMRHNKIQPSVVTYGTFIHGWCKNGEVAEALNFFRSLEELGLEANTAIQYFDV
jgi:pentatricopeptide repeat protein